MRSILLHLGQPARAIVAVAAYAGLRRSEITGLEWENYDGKQLNVTRSIWEGHVSKPKTAASKAPVPVIAALRSIVDRHRLESGNPKKGPMFRSQAKARTPLNMNNVLNRMILPVLNRCEICRKGKREHGEANHKYKRDASLPEWHGWHAFRRGLATNLHDLGVDDKTIQAILRHENVSMTQRCYIKTLPKQTIEAMNRFDETVSELPSENSLLCTECAPLDTAKPSKLLN